MERVLEPSVKTPVKTSAVKREAVKKPIQKSENGFMAKDRPKWIPAHIVDNWDTDPYAYQTEEELMPASGPHGEMLGDIWELINKRLRKQGLMLLMDIFMLFRDITHIKDRTAPDLLVVPYQEGDTTPSSYNLESEPTPHCVFEVVSPSSRTKDKNIHQLYIEHLDIPICVIIERVNSRGKMLKEAKLTVWRRDLQTGQAVQMKANPEGSFSLLELGMQIGVKGQSIYFIDDETGEMLLDTETERMERRAAKAEAEAERRRAELAEERAASAEAEIRRLRAMLGE